MFKPIILITPTRGRPDLMKRVIESWKNTTNGLSEIAMITDNGDTAENLQEYHKLRSLDPHIEMYIISSKHKELNPKNNYFVNMFLAGKAEVFCSLSDDFVFHTPGWENQILEWQRANKGICYGNDLLQGANLPTCPFIHRNIVKSLGFIAPPELIHYYIDNYWLELGMRLGKLQYFPEIIIEHKHWSSGKSEKDAVYSTSEALMGSDAEVWVNYRETRLALDVNTVQSNKDE